jgi:hypothetical protein
LDEILRLFDLFFSLIEKKRINGGCLVTTEVENALSVGVTCHGLCNVSDQKSSRVERGR